MLTSLFSLHPLASLARSLSSLARSLFLSPSSTSTMLGFLTTHRPTQTHTDTQTHTHCCNCVEGKEKTVVVMENIHLEIQLFVFSGKIVFVLSIVALYFIYILSCVWRNVQHTGHIAVTTKHIQETILYFALDK